MRQLFLRGLTALIGVVLLSGGQASADLLWNNEVNNGLGGVLVTHPGGMTGTAAGSDRSAIAVGGTLFGFGAQGAVPNRMADNFTMASAFTINSVNLFTYQTGATTSTINGATLQIWSGLPGAGTVVFGDTTTNVLTSTALSNIYRTTNTDTLGVTRRIQTVLIDGLNVNLAAGTYYLDWNFTGTAASGPWQPVLQLPGATGMVTGDAFQFTTASGLYNPALDGTTRQDLPFMINGTSVPEPAGLLVLALGFASVVTRRRR